jgi:hypothetical protein
MNTDPLIKLYAYNNDPYFFFYRPSSVKGYWGIDLKNGMPFFAMCEEAEFLKLMKQHCTPTEHDWTAYIYENYTDEFNVPIKVGSKETWTLMETWGTKHVHITGPRGGNRGTFELGITQNLARLLVFEGEIREVLDNITRHNKWPQIEEETNPA